LTEPSAMDVEMSADTERALVVGRRLWQQIQLRQHSGATTGHWSPGVHGLLDYYRGNHNLRFASDQFSEHFKKRFDGFTDNWCAPVVDAAAERMNHIGIRLGNDTRDADTEFQRVMEENDVARGTSEAFTVMLAATRSFGLVWGNPDDEQTPNVTFEHPEFCALARDPETRRTTASAKAWLDDQRGFLTTYMDDFVYKWQWAIPKDNDPGRPVDWTPRQPSSDDTWPIRNPLGRNPMFEFRNSTLLDDKPLSDISGVAAMQDAINLVWAYLMNGLDFASLPQRLLSGAEMPTMPILNNRGEKIGEKPIELSKFLTDRILWITGKDAKAQSWPAAQLEVFESVIGMAVDHVSSQTRTPPHYLMGKMSNTAAESLTVAETGLVARVMQRLGYATKPLREMYALVALAQGDEAKAKAARSGHILWADPQYRSLSQKVDGFSKFASGGMPLRWRLEWYGLSPAEVERTMLMAKDEAETLVRANPVPAAPGVPLPRGNTVIDLAPDKALASARPAEDPPSPAPTAG